MVASKNNPGNYKTLNISIGTIIKNHEVLRFVSDLLKAIKRCVNKQLRIQHLSIVILMH